MERASFAIPDRHEVLPPQPKRRGRQKKREIIGLYGANKDTRSGIIDIAMQQSMGNADDIKPWIRDHCMVIVDECHHVPAVSFEQVLKAVRASITGEHHAAGQQQYCEGAVGQSGGFKMKLMDLKKQLNTMGKADLIALICRLYKAASRVRA